MPRTVVQVDFLKNVGLAMNSGGTEPNAVQETLGEFDESSTIRYVKPLIEHIRSFCEKR